MLPQQKKEEGKIHVNKIIDEGKELVSYSHMFQLAKIQIFQMHGIAELMARDSFDRKATEEEEIQDQMARIKRRLGVDPQKFLELLGRQISERIKDLLPCYTPNAYHEMLEISRRISLVQIEDATSEFEIHRIIKRNEFLIRDCAGSRSWVQPPQLDTDGEVINEYEIPF